jgi:hypothetical protein
MNMHGFRIGQSNRDVLGLPKLFTDHYEHVDTILATEELMFVANPSPAHCTLKFLSSFIPIRVSCLEHNRVKLC